MTAGIRLLASERGSESVLREHRRVNALREITERLERFRHDVAEVFDHAACPRRISTGERAGDAKLHHECDEVLLRAVVDVAFDTPALGVLGVDDAPPGRANLRRLRRDGFEAVCELGGEANIAHDEPGLRREVVEEPQVGR